MNRYRKRENKIVTGVQLNLDTEGLTYFKWGSQQRCKAGDWLVDNDGDCYTISADSFSKTYEKVAPGQFVKVALIWAHKVSESGRVKTREGYTEYEPGDYIVSNDQEGSDSYAVSKAKFEAMYELIEADVSQ